MSYAFTLEGPPELIRDLEKMEAPGLETGRAVPLGSTADVLDSPIGIEEVQQVAEAIGVVAGSSTAVMALAQRIRKYFARRKDEPQGETREVSVVVRDALSNKVVAVVYDDDSLDLFVRSHS